MTLIHCASSVNRCISPCTVLHTMSKSFCDTSERGPHVFLWTENEKWFFLLYLLFGNCLHYPGFYFLQYKEKCSETYSRELEKDCGAIYGDKHHEELKIETPFFKPLIEKIEEWSCLYNSVSKLNPLPQSGM